MLYVVWTKSTCLLGNFFVIFGILSDSLSLENAQMVNFS